MASAQFRAGVVAVIRRGDGTVLAFERLDVPGAWQFPQGGIRVGERPQDAVWRELAEETGLGPEEVRLVHEHPDWVVYEFPDEVRASKPQVLGQVQRWFVFEPRVPELTPQPDGREFGRWAWWPIGPFLDQIVAFKAEAYREVLS